MNKAQSIRQLKVDDAVQLRVGFLKQVAGLCPGSGGGGGGGAVPPAVGARCGHKALLAQHKSQGTQRCLSGREVRQLCARCGADLQAVEAKPCQGKMLRSLRKHLRARKQAKRQGKKLVRATYRECPLCSAFNFAKTFATEGGTSTGPKR